MGKTLILAGGGHAHLSRLARLDEVVSLGHRAVLVSPEPFHYYSGMGPGLLGGRYAPQELRFDVRAMAEAGGGEFIASHVVSVDPAARQVRLADGSSLAYDVLSLNIGSRVPELPGADAPHVFAAKPIERLLSARERLTSLAAANTLPRVVVVGGGPAGVEIAGNTAALFAKARAECSVRLAAGRRFMAGHAPGLVARAGRAMAEAGVEVVEGARARRIEPGRVVLENGRSLAFDAAFLATGTAPPGLAAASGLPTGPTGGLLVGPTLEAEGVRGVFGGGDCIDFAPRPLAKVGVYAVRQNEVLAANLLAALEAKPYETFDPGSQRHLILLNLGDGTAAGCKAGWCARGRLLMALKDRIDRRFMRRFQVSGETGP